MAVKDSVNAPSKWVLAVDFGTSSTAAAIGRDGGAELVGVDGGLPRMLSNVFLDESNGNLLLGELAEQSSTLAPWCFERSPKVKLGQQYMLLGDRRVSVTDAVGQVLHKVAADAIRMRGGDQPAIVRLTHPVRWGDEKRNALVQAAEAAGLGEQLELVLEPVAAATHYAHERLAPGEHVAVYDLGGGTLDTAVLKRTEDGFEVVGEPRGIDGFGGEDFDHRLYRYLGEQLAPKDWMRLRAEPEEGGDTAWPSANRQFQRNVRRAKELLTANDSVRVEIPAPVNRALRLTRNEFNGLIRTDVEESVRELATSISSAVGKPSELVAIYLAGGSSQIPLISEVIEEQLGIKPQQLNDSKAVICLGAALPPLLSDTLGNGNGNGNRLSTEAATAGAITNPGGLGTGTDAGTIENDPQTTGNGTLADGTIVETDPHTADNAIVADGTIVETDRHTAADTGVAGGTVIETGLTDPNGADTGPRRSQTTSPPVRDSETASQPPRSTLPGSSPEEIGPGRPRFCPKCGKPAGGARFCANCGHEMATAPRPTSAAPPRLDPDGSAPNSSRPSGSGGATRGRMLLLIAGGAIAVAAIAVAVIVLSGGGGSSKRQPTVTGSQRGAALAAMYKGQVVKALTPLVTANQTLSTALVALDGSTQATNHAKTEATQAATALSSARGAVSVLTAPTAAGNLPSQIQQVLTADNGYLQAVASTLQSPTVSGASQLDTLATGAQGAFDGISNIIPAASSSVTGTSNLASWARGAAQSQQPKTQTASSSSSSSSTTQAQAPPTAATPSGTDCGGGVIAGFATSCPFALNVQRAWDEATGETATVTAFSPVTHLTYIEFCAPVIDNPSLIFCTDSDNSNSIWFPS